MSDWSMHRHISTVGIGSPLRDRAWCAACRKPWPCPVAERKHAAEAAAETALAHVSDMVERARIVDAMYAETARIDRGS